MTPAEIAYRIVELAEVSPPPRGHAEDFATVCRAYLALVEERDALRALLKEARVIACACEGCAPIRSRIDAALRGKEPECGGPAQTDRKATT